MPAALAAGLGFMQRASRTPHIMDPGVVAASAAPLGALLSDFSTALDATEWTLLFAAMGFSVSLAAFMVTVLVICIVPTPPSHMWMWRIGASGSLLLAMLCIVYIVEPRPSHWLPYLTSFWDGCHASFSGKKDRVRRWWRWRKRHEMKTKLNV